MNVIDLGLELTEPGELNLELPADVGELSFNRRQDLRAVRRRPCRPALTFRAALSDRATVATLPRLTARAACAVFSLSTAGASFCRHVHAILL